MADMLWGFSDALRPAFQLTKSLRATDPWLCAVLEAIGHGRETWEMYCFSHGLPTRNRRRYR